ncbi:MAG: hypothetical protein A3D74_04100 [Candidatus Levybacteria bacterium RIFCSPHIGHO2_02_FULL_37_13]|nr:MAG: hypothetical protein A3D74_04100 [Candidatus Levybacteria bacterium RIFCSPHIGHO2_02_FULL_37_13]OGH29903.1 MAG: hypothetical protein A3E40_04475 [Candidatus Levybacteria bacterium RIFCSPHIGHO2_12_FULL_37_9]
MTIQNLIWDEWNVGHIARHNVKPEEVEEVCGSRKIFTSKVRGQKKRIIGRTLSGRYLAIFLADKGENDYYIVTARDITVKEKKYYKRRFK